MVVIIVLVRVITMAIAGRRFVRILWLFPLDFCFNHGIYLLYHLAVRKVVVFAPVIESQRCARPVLVVSHDRLCTGFSAWKRLVSLAERTYSMTTVTDLEGVVVKHRLILSQILSDFNNSMFLEMTTRSQEIAPPRAPMVTSHPFVFQRTDPDLRIEMNLLVMPHHVGWRRTRFTLWLPTTYLFGACTSRWRGLTFG